MSGSVDYARHSRYSDPGGYAYLLDDLPGEVPSIAAVVRNVLVHYRAHGLTFTGERLAEADHRWVEHMLATDARRFGTPLAGARPQPQRVVGCCRDYTLLTVAALRHGGVPARSRVGFAGYFHHDFHADHVIVEYWDGARWVFADTQLDPTGDWPFDTGDLPRSPGTDIGARSDPAPPFVTAAQVWRAWRRGDIDADRYGVDPAHPVRGGWFVRNYVLQELAHRQGDELLLWDSWGAMSDDLGGDTEEDLALVDEVAALLLAGDGGDVAAERELAARYATDPRLRPGPRVVSFSPTGEVRLVDLDTRAASPTGTWAADQQQATLAVRSLPDTVG
jgi:hypothetical protein